MTASKNLQAADDDGRGLPWYRQFWPWFIIALPASAVIASLFSFWLAASEPDYLVIDEKQYQQLNAELKARSTSADPTQEEPDGNGD